MSKFLLVAVLLTAVAEPVEACTAPRHYPLQVRQTLLHGSDVALLSGCQRGVLRWHVLHTGDYPALADVAVLCEDVRRSFQDEMEEGNGET